MCARRTVLLILLVVVLPATIHTVPVRSAAWDGGGRQDSDHDRAQGPALAPGARTWDRREAELMTNFSRIAYCPAQEILDWSCATCNDSLKGFEVFYKERENMRHVGVYAGYFPKEDKAVVVFRGTDYLVNWIQDLMVYKVDSDYDCGYHDVEPHYTALARHSHRGAASPAPPKPRKRKCRVHSGFKYDWLSVREQVINATDRMLLAHPSAQVWVTGHSLGGALAALCALDLQFIYNASSANPKEVRLLTLGQPRVGNKDFADFVGEKLASATRVVHQNDVVPHLPPHGADLYIITEFHHHAREVWQTGTKDDTFVICNGSGEDPSCCNSLTPWDRSIEAHLWYLNLDMSDAC